MGKKRIKLSQVVKWTLIISGCLQMAVLQFHIDAINNLFSSLIGFYMFAFVLVTIINILNGSNFSAKKSVVTIISIYLVTAVQIITAALFIQVIIHEVNTIDVVSMTVGLRNSILFILGSVTASVVACVCSVVFYFKKTELDLYLG